jgi:hypothetical protein
MPDLSGMSSVARGLPLSAENAVRDRVDPDAEPRDAVASENAEHGGREDHDHMARAHVREHAEVITHANRDEDPQHREEFPLLKQIGLARFPDDYGNGRHRRVRGEIPRLDILQPAVDRADDAHGQPDHQDGAAAERTIEKRNRVEIRDTDIGLAGAEDGRKRCRQSSGGPLKGSSDIHRVGEWTGPT